MTIYTSEKVMPYVYMGIHNETGEFYIGSRDNKHQKLPSHLDLQKYRTSSKKVKPRFDEFSWVIIAEFFERGDAYMHEQELIRSHWGHPLLLNGQYRDGNAHFSSVGRYYPPRTEAQNAQHSAKMRGRKLSPEHIEKIAAARTGKPSPKKGKTYVDRPEKRLLTAAERSKRMQDWYNANPHTPENVEAIRLRMTGRKLSPETIAKRQETRKRNKEQRASQLP